MLINSYDWAYDTFSHAHLGDKRRVSRLIQLASLMANRLGKSVVKASSSSAEIEAAYRFIRNPAIDVQAIAEAGFKATADKLEHFDTVLALEDTTSLNFSHGSVTNELGHVTSHKTSRGIQAHSVLAFAPDDGQVLGLLEQTRWTRDVTKMGQKKQATQRPYREKESFKWERASRQMSARLGDQMSRVISVCDRESDIIDYLKYKCEHQQRFVVRCMMSRHIEEVTISSLPMVMCYKARLSGKYLFLKKEEERPVLPNVIFAMHPSHLKCLKTNQAHRPHFTT